MSKEHDPQDSERQQPTQRPPNAPLAEDKPSDKPTGELTDDQLDQANGGALNAYLSLKGQKQGDIKGSNSGH